MEAPRERRYFAKKKVCKFCTEGLEPDYKDIELLSNFINERKKIIPRRTSGLCAYHQRRLTTMIKRARIMALLPFTVLH
ncbi:MAG: 30S ribosomal protein S18 [Deltaproteobacteria bacterium]|jgi:small subunit ribosomal protein S18|nr:30S ribosomal protein S18 [bacterium HR37]GIW48246.1 MAG: 30S ribosomal protein S18 [Deltaproteobacteria bacterium]